MRLAEIKSKIIQWEQIESVANWLNYGSSDTSVMSDLLKFSGQFPKGSTSYTGNCFRAFGLSEKQASHLLNGKTIKYRPIESWTYNLNGISDFLSYTYGGSTTIEHENYIIAVLKTNPSESEVFLNISKLFQNRIWIESIKHWESQQRWFNEGLGFGGSQQEIILAKDRFGLSDIFGIADDGISSDQVEQQLMSFIN